MENYRNIQRRLQNVIHAALKLGWTINDKQFIVPPKGDPREGWASKYIITAISLEGKLVALFIPDWLETEILLDPIHQRIPWTNKTAKRVPWVYKPNGSTASRLAKDHGLGLQADILDSLYDSGLVQSSIDPTLGNTIKIRMSVEKGKIESIKTLIMAYSGDVLDDSITINEVDPCLHDQDD